MNNKNIISILDQIINAAYNFLCGFYILKNGGNEFFSLYAYISVFYFLTINPLLGGLFSIFSVDIIKLKKSKKIYIKTSLFFVLFGLLFSLVTFFIFTQTYKFNIKIDAILLYFSMLFGVCLLDFARKIDIINGESINSVKFSSARLALFAAIFFISDKLNLKGIEILTVAGLNFFGTFYFVRYIVKEKICSHRINKNFFFRYWYYGRWAALSVMALSFFDQGVYLYIKNFDSIDNVGVVKSIMYLYAVVGPFIQVFDLKSPQVINKIFKNKIGSWQIILFANFGLVVGGLMGFVIYLCNVFLWVPLINGGLVQHIDVFVLVSVFCSLMIARSFVTPFLRIAGAKGMFVCNIFSSVAPYIYIFVSGGSVNNYIEAFVIWAIAMFSSILFYAIFIYKSKSSF